eukprot:TRINITY_DN16733_c1_g1_i1.p1 TRINITY_DN16733_c1_g1~~TRINITY_DN16733_c1_g1_i1.p1  ORF type:complete len:585 (+),score=124.23 TRINITY_DN16733_c1_g1_i1:154-1908(+)
MAVRRAAGARWAARRAEEAARRQQSETLNGDSDGGGYDEPYMRGAVESPLPSGKPNSQRKNRRENTEPAMPHGQYEGVYGSAPVPAPYGMYPPDAIAMQAYLAGMSMAHAYSPWMYPGGAMYPPVPMPQPMYVPSITMQPPPVPVAAPMPAPAPSLGGKARQLPAKGVGSRGDESPHESRTPGKKKKGGRTSATTPSSATAVSEDMTPTPNGPENNIHGTACCAALADIRKHTNRSSLTLKEVASNVYDLLEVSRDMHGCRFLQMRLDEADKASKQACFPAFLSIAGELASDVFGHFVVQKLFEVCTPEQRRRLMLEMQHDVIKYSNEQFGCRVIQTAIQHVSKESQLAIVEELQANVVSCIESKHGNHVIQRCIEHMPPDFVGFIITSVEEQTERMASHVYGCRVVQRLLEHCKSHQLETLLEQILANVPKLAKDPYGNYVVQHVLQHGRKDDKKRIIASIRADIVQLSRQRFSSNVVEKCFEVSTIGEHAHSLEEERLAMMKAVIGEDDDPNPPLHQMMDDTSGLHVVQSLFERAKGAERETLLRRLVAAETRLRTTAVGKRLFTSVQREVVQGRLNEASWN